MKPCWIEPTQLWKRRSIHEFNWWTLARCKMLRYNFHASNLKFHQYADAYSPFQPPKNISHWLYRWMPKSHDTEKTARKTRTIMPLVTHRNASNLKYSTHYHVREGRILAPLSALLTVKLYTLEEHWTLRDHGVYIKPRVMETATSEQSATSLRGQIIAILLTEKSDISH